MSRFDASYDISRASGQCAATGQPINPGDSYVACLVERADDDGFDRVDYAEAAWQSGARPERLFSFWKTRMVEPSRRRVFVDDEVLLSLFDRLADETQPQRQAYRFVIGLILMRKRLLRCEGTRVEDGRSLWLMRRKGEPTDYPPLEMVDPRLSERDVQDVADQLGEILRGEL